MKFDTQTNSNMQNSMVMLIFFVFDLKYPFWTNLVQKIKIVSLRWNLIPRLTNWNMQNSMTVFTLFAFDQKCPFWTDLVQNVKIVSLRWNLIPRLIRICRIQWCCSFFFLFSTRNVLFAQIWSRMTKLSLSWKNLWLAEAW